MSTFHHSAPALSVAYVYTARDLPLGHPLSPVLIGILGAPRAKSGHRLILPVPLFEWVGIGVPENPEPETVERTDLGNEDADPS
jgi:hypothetical protein